MFEKIADDFVDNVEHHMGAITHSLLLGDGLVICLHEKNIIPIGFDLKIIDKMYFGERNLELSNISPNSGYFSIYDGSCLEIIDINGLKTILRVPCHTDINYFDSSNNFYYTDGHGALIKYDIGTQKKVMLRDSIYVNQRDLTKIVAFGNNFAIQKFGKWNHVPPLTYLNNDKNSMDELLDAGIVDDAIYVDDEYYAHIGFVEGHIFEYYVQNLVNKDEVYRNRLGIDIIADSYMGLKIIGDHIFVYHGWCCYKINFKTNETVDAFAFEDKITLVSDTHVLTKKGLYEYGSGLVKSCVRS